MVALIRTFDDDLAGLPIHKSCGTTATGLEVDYSTMSRLSLALGEDSIPLFRTITNKVQDGLRIRRRR